MLIANTIPGTTVDALTLSVHQQMLARQRIKEAGLEDRITVHLMDYRHMPKDWQGSFDRVVSCEMVEAVGVEFLQVRTTRAVIIRLDHLNCHHRRIGV